MEIRINVSSSSFRGILTEPQVFNLANTGLDNSMNRYTGQAYYRETRELYPFKDDTSEIINKEAKKYTVHKKYMNDLVECVSEKVVHIKEKLPCTKAEFKDFIQRHSISEKEFLKYIELFKLVMKVR